MKALENLRANLKAGFGREKGFDLDKMANPKFIEFMHKIHKDVAELDPSKDNEELTKRYQDFEDKGKVVTGLDKMYAEQLTGFTEVDAAERKQMIEDFIDGELADNPGKVAELRAQLEKYEESKKILDAQKRELKRFDRHKGAEGLKEKVDVLERAKGAQGVIMKYFTERPDEAVKRAKEEYKVRVENLDKELEKASKLLAEAGAAEASIGMMREEFATIRSELIAGLEVAEKLADKGREALDKKVGQIASDFDNRSLKDIAKEFEALGKLRNVKDGRNMVFSHDEEFNENFDQFMESYETRITDRMMAELMDEIDTAPLGELEKNLLPYLKSDRVGDTSAADLREKVREQIEASAEDDSVSDEKRFLLRVLLLKHEHLI